MNKLGNLRFEGLGGRLAGGQTPNVKLVKGLQKDVLGFRAPTDRNGKVNGCDVAGGDVLAACE